MTLFYLACDILIIFYCVYSWYWQAVIGYRARFRMSSIIWVLIFFTLGYSMDYFTAPTPVTNVFVAGVLTMSIIDGVSGLAKKRIVFSGFFKRTLKYSDVAHITLIAGPNPSKPIVMAVFKTKKQQSYYLRFSKQLGEVIQILRQYVGTGVGIEIRKLI
ncbi:hypothetical protein J2Z60_000639 [Lactobacillus colini]|uniref:Uncharacterized protein n=1 Tax=Lactobacillus colini TaxID=1819254 RepID=A0ABS4MCR7_9LACO|nr:hypothetical protein [Lactobacillus colini]MBP2057475.1 hypothetical protein [Lactobacillus colini]